VQQVALGFGRKDNRERKNNPERERERGEKDVVKGDARVWKHPKPNVERVLARASAKVVGARFLSCGRKRSL
jgi:hypothetical protein